MNCLKKGFPFFGDGAWILTKTPGKYFQVGYRMAHLFPIHHEMSKRKDREAGKRR